MESIRTWCERVRRLSEAGLESRQLPEPGGAEAWLASFRDELGHRRALDIAFLRYATGLRETTHRSDGGAATAWDALGAGASSLVSTNQPPLFPDREREGIEIWTEEELSGLHALWGLAARHARESPIDAFAPLVRWHVETLQPDNATQRPWGAHVFQIVGAMTDDAEAMLHADTLVHASIVRLGKPDFVSSLVLRDAADAATSWLETQAG